MYGRSFKQTLLLSISFAVSAVILGIIISYLVDITPSGAIVMLSLAIFGGTIGLKSLGLINHSKTLRKLSLSNNFVNDKRNI
jgi:zinc transport system permease protein